MKRCARILYRRTDMTPSALSLTCVSRDTWSREDDNFTRLMEQASCKRHPAHYARGKNKSHPSLILLMKLSEARQLSAARPVLHVCPLFYIFRQGLERGNSSVHVSPKSGSAEQPIYVLPVRGHRLTVSVHHNISTVLGPSTSLCGQVTVRRRVTCVVRTSHPSLTLVMRLLEPRPLPLPC